MFGPPACWGGPCRSGSAAGLTRRAQHAGVMVLGERAGCAVQSRAMVLLSSRLIGRIKNNEIMTHLPDMISYVTWASASAAAPAGAGRGVDMLACSRA